MSDFRPLGPPLRAPVLPPGPKVKATANPEVWSVDGKLQTTIAKNRAADAPIGHGIWSIPIPTPDVPAPIPAGEAVDFLIALRAALLERMADTEFPVDELGLM